jgi:penicillin-binding protein 1A
MASFQERQNRYYRKYPPRRGQLATVVISQRDKRRPGVNFRLGEQGGMLEEKAADQRAAALMASLQPGDVVQVRLGNRDRRTGKWSGALVPAPMVQAAVVSMELKSGKVRVLLGGKDFGDSTFNRAVQARRQPGSAFKPIIYAAAIDRGYRPDSILLDEPISLPGGRRGQAWTPQNYDHTFTGPIPLATALARSRNVPTVRLMMALGVPATVKMAQTLGITSTIFPNYASALGASEVTVMELTRAYSVFPNQGDLVEPIFIERIEDRDGRVLMESQPKRRQVIDGATAQIMTQLLRGVVEGGTGARVKVLKRPIGGKTGTTNRTRDAWFIGFTPSVITGAWVGMDDERSLGPKETGSQAAAPIFIAYMREALKNQPVEEFPALSETVLASRGRGVLGRDDEEAAGTEESFYPEEEATQESSQAPQASSQEFFKSDLEE